MAKIRKYIIDRVLERADIVDIVADQIGWYDRITNPFGLKKNGIRYTALCPFHNDKHIGNFVVYPKGNCYKCFACGEGGGVVDFMMKYAKLSYPDAIRYIGKKYDIEVDNMDVDYKPPVRPAPPPLPVLELPREWVRRTMNVDYSKITLTRWMATIPWDYAQRKRLREALWLYCVGGWRDGRTVFWMIDHDGIPRAAKLMQYHDDGHRDKTRNPGWIYNQDGCRQVCDPDNHEIIKPLFGIHLLKRYPRAAVNIVESEKTAIIMATAYGNHEQSLWMACGGMDNLSREKLAPIIKERRRIVVYPDRDAITKWREKVNGIRYDRLTVNVQAVQDWWIPADGEKADIADVVLRMIITHTKPPAVTVGSLMKKNPAVKTLVEKLNLKEIDDGTEKGTML